MYTLHWIARRSHSGKINLLKPQECRGFVSRPRFGQLSYHYLDLDVRRSKLVRFLDEEEIKLLIACLFHCQHCTSLWGSLSLSSVYWCLGCFVNTRFWAILTHGYFYGHVSVVVNSWRGMLWQPLSMRLFQIHLITGEAISLSLLSCCQFISELFYMQLHMCMYFSGRIFFSSGSCK
jgi:hypothetical protein